MASQFFVGIQLPSPWLAALKAFQARLRYQGLYGLDWQNPDCFHISLKSVGLPKGALIERIVLAMDKVAQACVPFELYADTVGIFGPSDYPKFVWTGVKGDLEGLKSVRETLQTELSALGYRRDHREFSPHITLARLGDNLARTVLSCIRRVVDTPVTVEESYLVQRLSLIHSFQGRNGWQHECVATAMMGIH